MQSIAYLFSFEVCNCLELSHAGHLQGRGPQMWTGVEGIEAKNHPFSRTSFMDSQNSVKVDVMTLSIFVVVLRMSRRLIICLRKPTSSLSSSDSAPRWRPSMCVLPAALISRLKIWTGHENVVELCYSQLSFQSDGDTLFQMSWLACAVHLFHNWLKILLPVSLRSVSVALMISAAWNCIMNIHVANYVLLNIDEYVNVLWLGWAPTEDRLHPGFARRLQGIQPETHHRHRSHAWTCQLTNLLTYWQCGRRCSSLDVSV